MSGVNMVDKDGMDTPSKVTWPLFSASGKASENHCDSDG
jgi:hypothetical protein